jgi:hypothetical protein
MTNEARTKLDALCGEYSFHRISWPSTSTSTSTSYEKLVAFFAWASNLKPGVPSPTGSEQSLSRS